MLIEAADDNQMDTHDDRGIQFGVDRVSLTSLTPDVVKDFEIDPRLLEQAVNCIVDNAYKCSYSNTVVDIWAGIVARSSNLHITVRNTGLRLRAGEVQYCKDREWRGEEAQLVTGEGSGIGLWIVDEIMKAHGGSVEIIPTDESGRTEVKLVFPRSVKGHA